jgi:predicted enzyme related to lactoylglutathione lyase
MPRVTHFELIADKPEKLIKFYNSIFGWEFQKWDGPMEYWMIKTGEEGTPGIDGGLGIRNPMAMPHNTMDVPNLDEFIGKVTKLGGKIIVPKMAVPGVGWLAYFEDPQGNRFGMMQDDPEAK